MIIKSKVPIGGDSKIIHLKDDKGVIYQTLICAPQQAIKVPDDFKYNEKEFEPLEKIDRKRYNVITKSNGDTIRGDLKEMLNPNTGKLTSI